MENDRKTTKKYSKDTGKYKTRNTGKPTPKNSARNRKDEKPFKTGPVQNPNSLCPYSAECGACKFIDVPYETQLDAKLKKTRALLEPFCQVDEIIGMKKPFDYRCKIHATFGKGKKGIVSGRFAEGTRRVVPVSQCKIEDTRADEIINAITRLAQEFHIEPYDVRTKKGVLRHILIRVGKKTRQILVVLVTGSPAFPSRRNFINALLDECPDITTVVQNVNPWNTGMILGDKEDVAYGTGYIEDTLCHKTFRISAKSFYQVNPVQTEILYEKAIEFAGLTGTEKVIDAYCGTGTIGLSALGSCGQVIGVENNKDAVEDAISNKKLNNAKHIQFVCDDAGKFMEAMAANGETADVVFMDPPRTGSTKAFIGALCTLAPDRVVYISCNPETLARDLKWLTDGGYKAEKACCVDMFPHTEHVECVVLLSKHS